MKFLPLVFKHLRRTWIRTGSTVAAMGLCIFLFCVLESVLARLNRLIEGSSPRRLVVRAAGMSGSVPLAYADRMRAVPGVRRVAAMTYFGGLLPARKEGKAEPGSGAPTDWTNTFMNIAVDGEPYFAMRPELIVAQDQFREFMDDLRGCVIGRQLAEKFGWRVGDRVHLESFIPAFRKRDGPFEFVIRGFIDADIARHPDAETNVLLFHFRRLDAALGGVPGSGSYLVEIDDPDRSAEVSAAIDALFENSSQPTYSETERAFAAEVLSAAGNLSPLVNGIGLMVTFTILLVTANTMSMAVRERRTEIAVLKALGFTGARVMALIVAEALLLGGLGGALGIALARAALAALNNMPGKTFLGLATVEMRPSAALLGLGAAALLGLAAGLLPAWAAYRARAAEALRSV